MTSEQRKQLEEMALEKTKWWEPRRPAESVKEMEAVDAWKNLRSMFMAGAEAGFEMAAAEILLLLQQLSEARDAIASAVEVTKSALAETTPSGKKE